MIETAKAKDVLLSIHPNWCALIADGRKTIEARKTVPAQNAPFRCLIYCTQSGKYKDGRPVGNIWLNRGTENRYIGNGKVIGEFICDRIVTIDCDSVAPFDRKTKEYIDRELCFGREELVRYSGFRIIRGLHISELVIYDSPKELSDFGLNRAPQSWCYTKKG